MTSFTRDFSPEDVSANPEYYRKPITIHVDEARNDAEQLSRIREHMHERLYALLLAFLKPHEIPIFNSILTSSHAVVVGELARMFMHPEPSYRSQSESSERLTTRDELVGAHESTALATMQYRDPPCKALCVAFPNDYGHELDEQLATYSGYEVINLQPSICATSFPDGHLFHLDFHKIKMLFSKERRTFIYILQSPTPIAFSPLLDSKCTLDQTFFNAAFAFCAFPELTFSMKAIVLYTIPALQMVDLIQKDYKPVFSADMWKHGPPHECIQDSHCPHRLRKAVDGIGFYFNFRHATSPYHIYHDLSRYAYQILCRISHLLALFTSGSDAIPVWRFGGAPCSRSRDAIMLPHLNTFSFNAGERFIPFENIDSEIDDVEEAPAHPDLVVDVVGGEPFPDDFVYPPEL